MSTISPRITIAAHKTFGQTGMTNLNSIPTFSNGFRFQWEEAQDSFVLLYPEGMVKLNESAGEILALVDNERSLRAIIDDLQAKFTDAPSLEQDVIAFMEEAVGNNWIQLK